MENLRLVHTEASTGWGGQEIRVFTECCAMRDRGHLVWLACPANSPLFNRAHKEGFSLNPFSSNRLQYPATVLRLYRWLKSIRPDVVNTHSSRDGYVAGIAARLAKVPCLVRTRHIQVTYPNAAVSRLAFHRLPDRVTTTSQAIANGLVQELKLNPNHVHCIPTGIPLNRFNSLERSLSPDHHHVAMVSVLRSWKGHRVFLEAIRRLRQEHRLPSGARFSIYGAGPMEQHIHSWIKEFHLQDRVQLHGHREDVEEVFAKIDLLVLPSLAHEGIPQAILQAQASGVPVIASEVGGIPEVITHAQTGYLVPPGKASALADALAFVINNREAAREVAQRARQHAHALYGIERMCDKTESLYRSVLTGKKSHSS